MENKELRLFSFMRYLQDNCSNTFVRMSLGNKAREFDIPCFAYVCSKLVELRFVFVKGSASDIAYKWNSEKDATIDNVNIVLKEIREKWKIIKSDGVINDLVIPESGMIDANKYHEVNVPKSVSILNKKETVVKEKRHYTKHSKEEKRVFGEKIIEKDESENMLEVYKYGVEVESHAEGIKGILTAICIRGKQVSYELSYFEKGKHETCWIVEEEFKTKDDVKKVKIGFTS